MLGRTLISALLDRLFGNRYPQVSGQNVQSVWFNWNQNSQTMGGLTIGKSTNTSNVTIDNTINANGSVSIYGSDIAVKVVYRQPEPPQVMFY